MTIIEVCTNDAYNKYNNNSDLKYNNIATIRV